MGNKFMDHIFNKTKRFNFKRWREYRKLIKDLKKSSPSFGILWQIGEFVRLLERVYMYNNSPDAMLYSSKKYSPGTSGFVITVKDIVKLRVKLYSDDQRVTLEVARLGGEQVTTSINFIDNQWESDHDQCDELLLEYCIDLIMTTVADIFTYYYKNKYKFHIKKRKFFKSNSEK